LFIGFFAAAAATLALVRERDLEKHALLGPSSRPSLAWLTVLGLPLAAVAGVALLLAAAIGPLAPIVGRAVARAAETIGSAIASVVRAIGRLIPRGHPTKSSTQVRRRAIRPPTSSAPPHPVHSTIHGPALAWELLTVVVVLAALVLLVRAVRPMRLSRRPEQITRERVERDSVFSWRHLLAQLWALLGRPFRRRKPPVQASGILVATDVSPVVDVSEVRQQYRRFLVATNSIGVGRQASETTHDFEQRLGAEVLPPPETVALGRLTRLYDRSRYGGEDGTGEEILLATRGADSLIDAIGQHAAALPAAAPADRS
jgi:hypothetical protein